MSEKEVAAEAALFIIHGALNEELQELIDAIERSPEHINTRGRSGDNALHIAAYKRHGEMIRILLERGADPNYKNSVGDTSFHISCRLGDIESLKLIYSCTRCDLLLKNNDQLQAIDISKEAVTASDVNLSHLYGTWTSNFNNSIEQENITKGRLGCFHFLQEKLTVDYDKRRQFSISTMQRTNIDYSRSTNMIRGKGQFDDRVFKSDLNYATSITKYSPHEIDYNRLKGDPEATAEAVTSIFATDLADRLLRSGIYGTSLAAQVGKLKALTATRTDLLDSFEDEEERVEER